MLADTSDPVVVGGRLSLATVFGAFDQVSSPAFVLALPIAAWEFALGVWMVIKGFKPSATVSNSAPAAVREREAELTPAVA